MNKNFEDAYYYLKRAAKHAKVGVKEEFAVVKAKVNQLRGKEVEPEPARLDRVKKDLKVFEKKAGGKVKENATVAKRRISDYRKQKA
ncbi:DUF7553 family protein [Haloarchaeobius sp. TZWWS8]|uniref:DUF7553 family protein n=1 Tax=Haloarchaeobius sp. TZWWS8 TaxID=3446121 RepID=UPI003EB734EF